MHTGVSTPWSKPLQLPVRVVVCNVDARSPRTHRAEGCFICASNGLQRAMRYGNVGRYDRGKIAMQRQICAERCDGVVSGTAATVERMTSGDPRNAASPSGPQGSPGYPKKVGSTSTSLAVFVSAGVVDDAMDAMS